MLGRRVDTEACDGVGTASVAQQLFIRFADGEKELFQPLVELLKGRVYSYVRRSGLYGGKDEDVFQEIFLRLYQSGGAYDRSRAFEPWFFAIVANTVRMQLRASRRDYLNDDLDVLLESHTPSSAASAQLCAEGRELELWFERAIAKLPPSQREVLLLCRIRELKHQDVADILGVPVNTVRTLLKRARDTLATGLEKRRARIRSEVAL